MLNLQLYYRSFCFWQNFAIFQQINWETFENFFSRCEFHEFSFFGFKFRQIFDMKKWEKKHCIVIRYCSL
jgi:hypothetical protein